MLDFASFGISLWAAIGVGLVVGLIVGITSIGAGALLTPALIFILGVPPALAVGTDVFIATVIKLLGGGTYALRRAVDWRMVGWLAAGSLPGAAIGLHYLNQLPPELLDQLIQRWLGGALLLGGAAILISILMPRPERPPRPPRALPTVLMGFVTGLLVGITSIGSGSVLTAMLVLFSPLNPARIVGTDMLHALALSAFTAAGHAAKGRINFPLAGAVLLGAAPGVLIGAQLATRLPARALKAALAIALLLVGAGLLSGKLGKARPRVSPAALAPSASAVTTR